MVLKTGLVDEGRMTLEAQQDSGVMLSGVNGRRCGRTDVNACVYGDWIRAFFVCLDLWVDDEAFEVEDEYAGKSGEAVSDDSLGVATVLAVSFHNVIAKEEFEQFLQ